MPLLLSRLSTRGFLVTPRAVPRAHARCLGAMRSIILMLVLKLAGSAMPCYSARDFDPFERSRFLPNASDARRDLDERAIQASTAWLELTEVSARSR